MWMTEEVPNISNSKTHVGTAKQYSHSVKAVKNTTKQPIDKP